MKFKVLTLPLMFKKISKNFYWFLAFSILFSNLLAQKDTKAYRKLFEEGNKLFLEKNYNSAVLTYLSAFNIDSGNNNIRYKVGLAYLYSSDQKTKSIRFLERACKNTTDHYSEYDPYETKSPVISNYYLGIAYQLNYEFDKAVDKFQYCSEVFKDKKTPPDFKLHIDQCNVAAELIKHKVEVKIENMGPTFNTVYPEYCPIINADESTLIFTSRRPGGVTEEKGPDGQYYEDIYISNKGPDGAWATPKLISHYINTELNDAAISLSADGQQLFVFSPENGGDIYYSNFDGGSWSRPLPLGSDINSKYWETHACVSADNQTIYFVSDRPGGYGGRDIYKCIKLPNGNWSLATNLGPTINSAYDEDAPFIHPDGVTLFFSSNGPASMGGFDIFYSTLTETKFKKQTTMRWTRPKNMGYPINTTGDDIYYVLSTDGKRSYFSSEREGSVGEKDLFEMTTFNNAVVNPLALLVGYLTFEGTNINGAANIRITATDVETGEIVQEIRPNVKTGKYIMVLSPGNDGKTYDLKYEAEGFLPYSEQLKIESGSSYQELKREVRLKLVNFEAKRSGDVTITGIVRNSEGVPVTDAKVIVKDNTTGEIVKTYQTLNDSGFYYASLRTGRNYNISFETSGTLFHSENVDIPAQADYSVIKRDIKMEKAQAGASIILRNVFFKTGKATLTKESKIELEKIYDLLGQNKDYKVEIGGHTDAGGEEHGNLNLSQERAQAVVDYLIKNQKPYYIAPFYYKGIDAKRVVSKGYGSSKPIADNKTEEGRKMNRRVEMKIISTQ